MMSLGSLMYINTPATRDTFFLIFSICILLISFSYYIVLATTSSTVLKRNGQSGHLVLFMILLGMF